MTNLHTIYKKQPITISNLHRESNYCCTAMKAPIERDIHKDIVVHESPKKILAKIQ